MIFADIHGKLGGDYSRAHERGEDVLTSNVFGLLRYIPQENGLLRLLQQVRPFKSNSDVVVPAVDPHWIPVERVRSVRMIFWPSFGAYGEPDLLLSLRDEGGHDLHLVLIEAKYLSPKSGRGDPYEAVEDDAPHGDQLVKYWQASHDARWAPPDIPRSLIYLTAAGVPPSREIHDSLRHLCSMRLAWLSWRDVWSVVEPIASTHAAAADLAALLVHKGLTYFRGFVGATPRRFPDCGFWHSGMGNPRRIPPSQLRFSPSLMSTAPRLLPLPNRWRHGFWRSDG